MRAVIAEDSVLLRAGLERLLADADIETVDAVGDGESLLRSVEKHRPDVCIVDVRMPPTFSDEGVRAALVLRRQWPDVGVLVLSQYVEERYAADLITTDTRGLGYLLKDRVADIQDFLSAVEQVAAGGTVLDPEVVSQLLARRRRDSRMERLTPRERQVLALMAEGSSNQTIADRLYVSAGSVEKHISAVFQKLELEPEDGNRRVLAVLAHLDAPHPSDQPDASGGHR